VLYRRKDGNYGLIQPTPWSPGRIRVNKEPNSGE
jgi:hypothetical protein